MRRTTRRMLATIAVALVAVAGCGEDDPTGPATEDPDGEGPGIEVPTDEAPSEDEAPSDDDQGGVESGSGEAPSDGADPGGGDPDAAVDAAVADLAEREGADPADISVITLEEVTWSDGSIGCPQPGQAYTQALVEGTRLVLELDGEEYHFHGAGDGALSYCADPREPASTGDAVQ